MGPKYSKQLVPTARRRELVPVAYQMIINGASLAVVAEWLTERTGPAQCEKCEGTGKVDGKKCRDCIAWWPKVVAEMVRRPVYRGQHTNSAGVVVHKCEALVDAVIWKRANDSLNARPKRGKVYAENRAMLAGALTCPVCKGPMNRNFGTNYEVRNGKKTGRITSQHAYYRCQGTGPQRKSCGNMVPLHLADAAVNAIIAETFNIHVMIRKLTLGHDHSVELAEIAFELDQLPRKSLPWAEEDTERARLRAEYTRVSDLPSVPDQWKEVPNGHTYAALWDDVSTPERGQWLSDHGFIVQATKERLTVIRGDVTGSVDLPDTGLYPQP